MGVRIEEIADCVRPPASWTHPGTLINTGFLRNGLNCLQLPARVKNGQGAKHPAANKEGNDPEATASAMFVYSMAKAVNRGQLSREFVPAILKGFGKTGPSIAKE